MNKKLLFAISIFFIGIASVNAQIGIRVGVNMSKEITNLDKNTFNSENLTGYQIGLIYQSAKKGLGFETGLLLSQKGNVYKYNNDSTPENNIINAYKEINCVTLPFNLKYKINIGPIGVFGLAGIYGDYDLSGKTVVEALNKEQAESYNGIGDRINYGYMLGLGVEALGKLQLAANWNNGLMKKNESLSFTDITNYEYTTKTFSINLTYLF